MRAPSMPKHLSEGPYGYLASGLVVVSSKESLVKPTKTKSELEDLILQAARTLDLGHVITEVTVRGLRKEVAGANWIVASTNANENPPGLRAKLLRIIVPAIRDQFDLAENDCVPWR